MTPARCIFMMTYKTHRFGRAYVCNQLEAEHCPMTYDECAEQRNARACNRRHHRFKAPIPTIEQRQ